jgi:hypothetical protein
MSRHESDREDLLREATALVERAELNLLGYDEPVVVGFRRDGSVSCYFGADPVYQFNTNCELRRAYLAGLLYKAEHGKLIALRRERNETEVALVRTELSADKTAVILFALQQEMHRLNDALACGSFTLHRQVPADADVTGRIRTWLCCLPPEIPIARLPNVR